MQPKIKALLLMHELTRTGAPRIALDAFHCMREEVEAAVISIEGGPLEGDAHAIGRLHVLAEMWPRGRIWDRLRWRYQWAQWVRSIHLWDPDIIYVNSVAALPILEMVTLPQVPVIVHVHELHSELLSALDRCPQLLKQRPSRYLAASRAVVRALISECGVEASHISVVHEFVPERRLDGVGAVKPERSDEGSFVIGGAGMPSWRKGVTLWLQTASEVRKLLGPSARFVWVGVPERPEPCWLEGLKFRREIKLMGLERDVEVIPVTPNPSRYFGTFDVFAMTSWEDPCPLVVLENMALGTPVVCFKDGGGSAEAVGDAGVIIPDFDPRAMARAIAELATNPEKRSRLGARARQRILARFTDRVQVPKIQREIWALAGRQKPTSYRRPPRGPRVVPMITS
jgi:glycosyltransferase involved in cell wall biosynthesis